MNMFWELLEAVLNVWSFFRNYKFWSSENTENTMSHLYFNEESDYFKENTCENEVFRSTIERN